jgi:translocation and assembly module TamA
VWTTSTTGCGLGWRAVSKLQLDTKNPYCPPAWSTCPTKTAGPGSPAPRPNARSWATTTPTACSCGSAAPRADRIDRNYYLQYDFTKLQGTGAPTSSSSITANYGWTGRYFNNPISPTSGFGFAWEVGAGTTLTPEREPFGRVSARWLTLIGLGDPDQAGRQSRLACVPPAAP